MTAETKKQYRDRIHLVTQLTAALLTRNETTLRLGKRETTEAVIRKACEIYDDILDRISVIDQAKGEAPVFPKKEDKK
jgi:hypothetical protein